MTWGGACAVNEAGYIIGYPNTAGNLAGQAFSYANGVLSVLATLGGSSSLPFAVNDAGTVVGHSFTAGNAAQHAFIYRNGQMLDLNSLINLSDTYLFDARGINDLGQIVANAANGKAYLLTPIPEPSTYAALIGAAVFGLVALRRRRAA